MSTDIYMSECTCDAAIAASEKLAARLGRHRGMIPLIRSIRNGFGYPIFTVKCDVDAMWDDDD